MQKQPYDLQTIERREKVAALMKAQVGQTEIARRLHLPTTTVRNDVLWIVAQRRQELFGSAVDAAAMEEERLKEMERQLIEDGDKLRAIDGFDIELFLKIIDRRLKIMERRAAMLGLDAPDEVNISVIQVNAAFAQMIAGIMRLVTDSALRRGIIDVVNEVLQRYGAGSCSPQLEEPENGTSCAAL